MANLSDSVCLNHPDTPATTRCTTCGRPVCSKCVVRKNGADYCSESCAASAQASAGRVSSVMASKKKSESGKRIRTIIILIILIVVGLAGYGYYRKNKSKVDRSLQSTLRKTESTIITHGAISGSCRRSRGRGCRTGSSSRSTIPTAPTTG